MTFNPLLFLDIASSLARDSEANRRTAVNRLYFAIHLRVRQGLVKASLLQVHEEEGQRTIHSDVIEVLKRKKRWAAGQDLGRLRELRVKADYKLEEPTLEEDLDRAFAYAEKVQSTLSNLGDWDDLPT